MTIAGVKVAALIEIAILIAIVLVLDQIAGAGDGFFKVQPHPFWVIVILLSAQYGAIEGLIAAILCSLALLVPALPALQFGEDIFDYALRVGLNPAMWLAAALVVGEMRSSADRRSQGLAKQLKESEIRENFLASAAERLALANRALEDRVAGQLRTVASLYEAAKAVEKLGPGDVIVGIAALVRAGLNPQKFSVYLLNETQLEAVFNEGWELTDKFQRVYPSASAIFQEVAVKRRRLCAVYAPDALTMDNEALLAGPIQSAETGQVVGMLKIEKMDILDFNMTTVENFRVLSEWIGTAYARARLFERVSGEARTSMARSKTGLAQAS
jgi:hypothetical protein